MMTIRQAISEYYRQKLIMMKRCRPEEELGDIVQNTSLCVIIPLSNGVRIFIDMHHEVDRIRDNWPNDLPNKNGIFKRVTFEILETEEGCDIILPESIKKYLNKSSANGVKWFVDAAKERSVNEFMNANGGIDEHRYAEDLNDLFEAY